MDLLRVSIIPAKWMMVIEASSLVCIIIIAYLYKLISYLKQQQEIKFTRSVTRYLSKLIPLYTEFTPENFLTKWRRLDVLVPIFIQLDKESENKNWQHVRILFFHSIILPLALNAATSEDWVMRLHAAMCFAALYENSDENFILQLAQDKIPLIRYVAVSAILISGSDTAKQTIKAIFINENWLLDAIELYRISEQKEPHVIRYSYTD